MKNASYQAAHLRSPKAGTPLMLAVPSIAIEPPPENLSFGKNAQGKFGSRTTVPIT